MPESLKIALTTSSFIPARGGAEIGLHNIALQLLNKGHIPVVVTSMAHERAIKRSNWQLPYAVLAYPPRTLTWRANRPLLARSILNWYHARIQHRYGFDVWHATFGYPTGVTAIEFCKKRGIAHLVRCVGADIQMQPEIGYGMRLDPQIDKQVRYWLPKAQCLVATTNSVVDEYKALGIDDITLARIPNGIDLRRFRSHPRQSDFRSRHGIPNEAIVFLALGRNHPKKNFKQLIEAAALLKEKSSMTFVVVVAGRGATDLKQQIQAADAQDVVRLVEPDLESNNDSGTDFPSNAVLDCYFSADVFVIPSLVETFGIVTVEAMASGLPVIAADSPGCRDIVGAGRYGRLYDGSTSDLMSAMSTLMSNPETRKDWATKSLARASEFDWSIIVDQYLDKYRDLISQSSPAHGTV